MMQKALGVVFSLIGLVVAMVILFTVGQPLVGQAVASTQTGYISNTTGCYIDMATPTSDVLVNGSYCSTQTLWPIILPLMFVIIGVVLMFGVLKGYIKL